jgi:hypothetical protein
MEATATWNYLQSRANAIRPYNFTKSGLRIIFRLRGLALDTPTAGGELHPALKDNFKITGFIKKYVRQSTE